MTRILDTLDDLVAPVRAREIDAIVAAELASDSPAFARNRLGLAA